METVKEIVLIGREKSEAFSFKLKVLKSGDSLSPLLFVLMDLIIK